MDEQVTHTKLVGFAYYIEKAREAAKCGLEDDELASALAARGIQRHDLEKLAESADEVSQCFYNTPKPV